MDDPFGAVPSREAPIPADAWDAFILLTDIVGFSEYPQWQQVEMVRYLFQCLMALDLIKELPRGGFLLSSTGDGFLLAFPSHGGLDLPMRLCDAALGLVEAAKACRGGGFAIRAGIHKGDVVSKLAVEPVEFAVGIGLNWCARVASLAATSQVLVSERFVKHAVQRVAPVLREGRFYPPVDQAPFELRVKHGRLAKVRVVRPRKAAHGDGALADIPHQLSRNLLLTHHIELALEAIGTSFEEAVRSVSPRLTPKRLRTRLTLWVGRADEMVPLPYSYHDATIWNAPTPAQRVTRYRVHRGASPPPQGPVARCWLTGSCQRLVGLPDKARAPVAYRSALEDEGIPVAVSRTFSRPARALLCVPLPLLEGPSGVLCIDVMHPLDDLGSALDELLEEIRVASGYFLAALLELRLN